MDASWQYGFATVLGSVLAPILGMALGFKLVLAVAGLGYALSLGALVAGTRRAPVGR